MLPLLFDLFALLYAIQAVRTLVTLARNWRAFWDPLFTPQDARLAQEVGFFLFIPMGVFLHEVGHYVAAKMAGVQVLGFHYRLFWGYVSYRGPVPPLTDWWIALSGNLVSILFGLALLVVGYRARGLRLPLRYTLFYAGQIESVYALIGYPLLSFSGFVGDWVTIYDFRATPVVSTITLLAHLVTVLVLLTWWRGRARTTSAGGG